MKWKNSARFALMMAQLWSQAFAATTCKTIYASTSTSKVPTITSTKTIKSTFTSTTYDQTFFTTTIQTTYISIVGKKTTTVPTGPSFTALTNCPTTTVTYGSPGKRSASAPVSSFSTKTSAKKPSSTSPKPTSYPKSVVCSTTVTSTQSVTTSASYTYTITAYSTHVSVSHVPTSTAYAACATDNVLPKYKGKYILLIDAQFPLIDPCDGTNGTQGQIECRNAVTCCEGAQRGNYNGYSFDIEEGISFCYYFPGFWQFNTFFNETEGPTCGNGPQGSGVFQHVVELSPPGGSG